MLWEGKKPVYATLVSSGQAGIDDPKKTTATVRGVFHIRNKHITATMDSNESSSRRRPARTRRRPHAIETPSPTTTTSPRRGARVDKKASAKGRPKKPARRARSKASPGATGKAKAAAGDKGEHEKKVPRKGDGEYGVTKRRGEGTFALHDVPYIQYFESGYALHAAYWHDVFGTPRSHGCVNLAPVDAHRDSGPTRRCPRAGTRSTPARDMVKAPPSSSTNRERRHG